jgi:alpha-galactosidase/6-phospho-beta-glucosidase family protein
VAFTDLHEIGDMFAALSVPTYAGLHVLPSAEKRAAYYQDNRERILAYQKARGALPEVKERRNAWFREYRERQKEEKPKAEKPAKAEKKRKPRNKAKRAQAQAAYRERNLEAIRARDLEYSRDPEVLAKRLAYLREWKKARKAQA